MPTVYSGVLLIGQFNRWSLLKATMTSGRAAASRSRISVIACRACVCWLFGARSNQPVSPGECVMAIAATIWAMAQRSRRSSSAWSAIACAASSGYAR